MTPSRSSRRARTPSSALRSPTAESVALMVVTGEAYRLCSAREAEDEMGLLEGKNALIFGVANDHSIAWGIARALHDEGAQVGFSSIESLIEKRVRPLATSIGSTFVEPADVQSDEDIARVFERWGESHDRSE